MKSSDKKPKHPNRRQLQRFINGDLSAKNQSVVEKHLQKCDECVSRLESIEGDTLGDRLLEVGTYFNHAAKTKNDEAVLPLLKHERYELIERIGAGGMGDVFRAKQRSMDRPVAIKVLKQSLFENDRAIARFHNEIKVAARLNHPNIVHSYDAEVSNGVNLLVMELVEGDKLSDIVHRNGPLTADKATDIAIQIAKGLGYASQQRMIHRDIKPQNIMLLPDGTVKITDFGLAKFVLAQTDDNDGSLTLEGEVFGTPDYIAPEQIRDSGSADLRSDIYSLGCTLYFVLTGHPPFAGFSVGEKLAGHLEKKATRLRDLKPSLSRELSAVIEKMMNKDPDLRFQSYSEVETVLNEINVGNSPTATDLGSVDQPMEMAEQKMRLRRRWLLPMIGIPILAVFGLWFSGSIANVFSSGEMLPSAPNSRSGKIKFAIVIPSVNAFHPEIYAIAESLSEYENAELEYIADQVGRVKFNSRKRGTDPQEITIARTLSDVSESEYDVVIFTGGWDGDSPESTSYAFDSALNDQAKEFAETMMASQKPVGSICGGTVVLAKAGLLRGKKTANCRYISDEIKENSGAAWTEFPRRDDLAVAVQDGLLVTGGNYRNAPEVLEMLMKLALDSRKASEARP